MKKLLIIKPDHIGDYILFRNILREIKNSTKYKNYEITFLGNTRFKDIAEFLDGDYIDKFIWIDLELFSKMNFYFDNRIKEISSIKYDVVINSILNNLKSIELLASKVEATTKILIIDNMHTFNENNYQQVIDISINKSFQFERLKNAYNEILYPYQLTSHNTLITDIKVNKKKLFDFEYIIVFIGADVEFRKWSTSNYTMIIDYILKTYDINIILAGGPKDTADAGNIISKINSKRIHNLVGETTLVDLFLLINQSKALISNETSAVHLAISQDIQTLVISNGNSLVRFTPYPLEYTKKYLSIYPFSNEKIIENKELYFYNSPLDINTIKIESIINTFVELFKLIKIKKKPAESFSITSKSSLIDLNETQINLNYEFSLQYSFLLKEVTNLKNSNQTFLVYGNGHLGKQIQSILNNQVIGVIDKSDESSFQYLNLKYDKIIISVLGRENIIINNLVTNFNLPSNKIFTFKLKKDKYNV